MSDYAPDYFFTHFSAVLGMIISIFLPSVAYLGTIIIPKSNNLGMIAFLYALLIE